MSADPYERGVKVGPLYVAASTNFREYTHPWEFPDRIRWPQMALFPRLDRLRAKAHQRQWQVRYGLAKALIGHEVDY